MDQIVAHVWFVDAIKRTVFQQADGRQYVLDDDGEPVPGVWLIPKEEVVPDVVIEGRHYDR